MSTTYNAQLNVKVMPSSQLTPFHQIDFVWLSMLILVYVDSDTVKSTLKSNHNVICWTHLFEFETFHHYDEAGRSSVDLVLLQELH